MPLDSRLRGNDDVFDRALESLKTFRLIIDAQAAIDKSEQSADDDYAAGRNRQDDAGSAGVVYAG